MRRREVVFSPEARDDVNALFEWIVAAAGQRVALNYIDRLEAYCRSFDVAAERGTRRDDIREGLRIVGFERRATVAFHVEHRRVTILRVFYGGQDWEDAID
ncbi:MAG: type II toxin-antitoxin system RelE/ParE family toxin [Hyphomicrobiales bacterium]|nr:type II toxin-antitoxin system RelE/ParE family toxin [Hyphomicrobiales bacterium]